MKPAVVNFFLLILIFRSVAQATTIVQLYTAFVYSYYVVSTYEYNKLLSYK